MTVEEMLDWATDQEHLDLQMLIMFLVYEKKALSLSDHSDKIPFYTQEKFNERMKGHLAEYKAKLNITYKNYVYSIITQKGTVYVLARSENDARYLVGKHRLKVESVEVLPLDYELVESIESEKEWIQTTYTVKELRDREMKVPKILGGFGNG